MRTVVPLNARLRIRRLLWMHPEWWVLAGGGVAWIVMVRHSISHWGHEHHHVMTAWQEVGHWLLMICAMMLPLTLHPLRIVAFRSLPPNRHRAMGGFLAGYLAVWFLACLPVVWFHSQAGSHSLAPAAIAFTCAAIWALVPVRKRALVACHRTMPIVPTGLRADLSCARFGGTIGTACVTTCWPLMAACALTGHALVAMIVGSAAAALERLSFRPPVRAVFAAHFALAAWFIAMALR